MGEKEDGKRGNKLKRMKRRKRMGRTESRVGGGANKGEGEEEVINEDEM